MILDTEKFLFNNLLSEFAFLESKLDFDLLQSQKEDLEKQQSLPNFFSDAKKVKENGKSLKNIENKLKKVQNIKILIEDTKVLFEMLIDFDDNALFEEIKEKLSVLEQDIKEFKIETILNGKYDNNNAILSLHAGAG
ncbi:MAG: PCRF domain-containing protein, partial [Clostridia bacterium]|nr:PCRF domain-containing protein [Clostridia bacterium]